MRPFYAMGASSIPYPREGVIYHLSCLGAMLLYTMGYYISKICDHDTKSGRPTDCQMP